MSTSKRSMFYPAFNYGECAIIKSKAGLNSDITSEFSIWIRAAFKPVKFDGFRTGREEKA